MVVVPFTITNYDAETESILAWERITFGDVDILHNRSTLIKSCILCPKNDGVYTKIRGRGLLERLLALK